jgi:predicted ferric reductase
MNTIWQTVTWNIARTGGFTAYILLTLSVVLGLALSLHMQTPRWPRIINNELHNFLTLLALIFTGIHVLAVWLDPFTHFGWNEVLIPLASHYRPVWMAFGIIALYLGLAVGLSTWIRPRIGYKWWRRFHVLTLLLFGLVAIHGVATGSDTRTWWGAAIYAISVLAVGTLLYIRLYKPATARDRSHPVLAGVVVAIILIGVIWAMLGPFTASWTTLVAG